MNEEKYKRQFAALLVKLEDPFKAAFKIFPNDTKAAIKAANEWPKDRIVIDQQIESDVKIGDETLPTKSDLKLQLWERMKNATDDDYTKMAKVYAEVCGFIEKQGTQVNVQNVTNKVMQVSVFESDKDWELKTAAQQERLLSESN